MVYKIDPVNDRQFADEFRRNPIGSHSPGLMRVLSILRVDPSGNQVILVCRKPFAKWTLAVMPPRRQDPNSFRRRYGVRKPRGGGMGSVPPPLVRSNWREPQPLAV